MFVKYYYIFTPCIVLYRILSAISIYITVVYCRFTLQETNIYLYRSPIKKYEYSFMLMLFDIFIISPKHVGFIINYIYFSGRFGIKNRYLIFISTLKLIWVIIIIAILGIPYILYKLIIIIINNIKSAGFCSSVEENIYHNVRGLFTYDRDFGELAIRVFDGFVKLNVFFIKKNIYEYIIYLTNGRNNTLVHESEITLYGRDWVHRYMCFIPGSIDELAISTSHNSPVMPIIGKNNTFGLKQQGFIFNPKNSLYIGIVEGNRITNIFYAMRLVGLQEMVRNKEFLKQENINSSHNNKYNAKEFDINLMVSNLKSSEDYKIMDDLLKSGNFTKENIKDAINNSSNNTIKQILKHLHDNDSVV